MAWTGLKTAIAAVIKTNGNKEITGDLLQQALISVVDQIGAGASFLGYANVTTVPGTPDGNVFYIGHAGYYVNFGGLTLTGLGILKFDGTNWSAIQLENDVIQNAEQQQGVKKMFVDESVLSTSNNNLVLLNGKILTYQVGLHVLPDQIGIVASSGAACKNGYVILKASTNIELFGGFYREGLPVQEGRDFAKEVKADGIYYYILADYINGSPSIVFQSLANLQVNAAFTVEVYDGFLASATAFEANLTYGGDSYTFVTHTPRALNLWDGKTFIYPKAFYASYSVTRIGVKARTATAGKFARVAIFSNIALPKNIWHYSTALGTVSIPQAQVVETVASENEYSYEVVANDAANILDIYVQVAEEHWSDPDVDLTITVDPERSFIYREGSVNQTLGVLRDSIKDLSERVETSPSMSVNVGCVVFDKGDNSIVGGSGYECFSIAGTLTSPVRFGIKNDGYLLNGVLEIVTTQSISGKVGLSFFAENEIGPSLITPTETVDERSGFYVTRVEALTSQLYMQIDAGTAMTFTTFRIRPSSGFWLDGAAKTYLDAIEHRRFDYLIPATTSGISAINSRSVNIGTVTGGFRIGVAGTKDFKKSRVRLISNKPIVNMTWYKETSGIPSTPDEVYTTIPLSNGQYLTEAIAYNAEALFIQCYIAGAFNYDTIISIDRSSYATYEETSKVAIDKIDTSEKVYDYIAGNTPAYKKIRVKKDGTGDYTTIPAAIASINDASVTNQYEVLIYDDWEWNDPVADFTNFGGMSVFDTKNYVHLRGMNGTRLLFANLPNNIASNLISVRQICYWHYNCNLTNLEFRIKNGRYAVHTDGGRDGDANTLKKCYNVKFRHLGNQDADNFASWQSDVAWGVGSSNGSKYEFTNCQFEGRDWAVASHTNHDFDSLNTFNFYSCKIISRLGNYAVDLTNLGSQDNVFMRFENCSLRGGIKAVGELYGVNQLQNKSVLTQLWKIFGGGNTDTFCLLDRIRVLRLVCPINKGFKSISGTAKALIFGEASILRAGTSDLAGAAVGNVDLRHDYGTPFGRNYMCSLGHRLGDCSTINKTLIVTLSDDTTATVTFNKNYSGGTDTSVAPTYSNAQILAEIALALTSLNVQAYDATGGEFEMYPNFADRLHYSVNASLAASILQGTLIEIDYEGNFKPATSKIDGIATRDIAYRGIVNVLDDYAAIYTGKICATWNPFSPIPGNPAKGTKYDLINGQLVVNNSSIDPVAVVLRDDMPTPARDVVYFGHSNFSIIKFLK